MKIAAEIDAKIRKYPRSLKPSGFHKSRAKPNRTESVDRHGSEQAEERHLCRSGVQLILQHVRRRDIQQIPVRQR